KDEARVGALEADLASQRSAMVRVEESRALLERELADVARNASAQSADGDAHRAAIAALERRCAELEQAGAAALAAERDAAERKYQEADARAAHATARHDQVAALLKAANDSLQGAQSSADAKRGRTLQAWEEAEARAAEAI